MNDLIQAAQERRLAQLMRLAPVRAAIDERLTRLRGDLATRAIGRRLADLRGTFEQIAAEEVDRALAAELRGLDDSQREVLQRLGSTVARASCASSPRGSARGGGSRKRGCGGCFLPRSQAAASRGRRHGRRQKITLERTNDEFPTGARREAALRALYERACRVIPGGVNSPVRAFARRRHAAVHCAGSRPTPVRR